MPITRKPLPRPSWFNSFATPSSSSSTLTRQQLPVTSHSWAVSAALVGDGVLDASPPEVLIPNRYGLPAHFERQVWAWGDNPQGAFVDWNDKVASESK